MKCINAPDKIKEKLNDYMELVLEYNKVMNLTGITDKDEFVEKHFYDSLLPTEVVDFNNKKIVDIGSGAGFPGIPLAIAYPNSSFLLVEPMNKRCEFLRVVKEKLNLTNVTILCERAENIKKDQRESFDIALSRAVSNLSILLELCVPYLKVGGIFLAYKGIKYEEELKSSKNALNSLFCEVTSVQNRKLPITNDDRFNIIIKKSKKTDLKFPRDFSQIKKKPL